MGKVHEVLATLLVAYAEHTLRKHPKVWVPSGDQLAVILAASSTIREAQ